MSSLPASPPEKGNILFLPFPPWAGEQCPKKRLCSTHLSQVSRREHTKVVFLYLSVSYSKVTSLQGKKSLGCCGFKGNSKPAKVAKGKTLENLSSPLIHGIGAVCTANTVSSSCWRGKNLPLLMAARRMLKERDVSICFLGIFYGEYPLTPPTQTQKLLPDI